MELSVMSCHALLHDTLVPLHVMCFFMVVMCCVFSFLTSSGGESQSSTWHKDVCSVIGAINSCGFLSSLLGNTWNIRRTWVYCVPTYSMTTLRSLHVLFFLPGRGEFQSFTCPNYFVFSIFILVTLYLMSAVFSPSRLGILGTWQRVSNASYLLTTL